MIRWARSWRLAAEVGADLAKFTKYLKIEVMEDLSASRFDRSCEAAGAQAECWLATLAAEQCGVGGTAARASSRRRPQPALSPPQASCRHSGTATWPNCWLNGPRAKSCSTTSTVRMDGARQGVGARRAGFLRVPQGRAAEKRFGFVWADQSMMVGCSPDGLVGNDGQLEIKVPMVQKHVLWLCRDVVPKEHFPQIQMQLWVTKRAWCDFLSFAPNMPPLIKRVEPDKVYQDAFDKHMPVLVDELVSGRDKLRSINAVPREKEPGAFQIIELADAISLRGMGPNDHLLVPAHGQQPTRKWRKGCIRPPVPEISRKGSASTLPLPGRWTGPNEITPADF